jgi:type IV pilus assembly protein PilB
MKILKLNEETKIYKPVGCPECNGSGYKGRIAAYEILTINSEMRDLISQNASVETLRQLALKNGMKTLSDSCTRLILTGVTSLEEMMSVVSINE